jgi:hypothetical protein
MERGGFFLFFLSFASSNLMFIYAPAVVFLSVKEWVDFLLVLGLGYQLEKQWLVFLVRKIVWSIP